MNSIAKKIISLAVANFGLLLAVSLAGAQPQASWGGKYEGSVKDEKGVEHKMVLDFTDDGGKYAGTLSTANGSFKILKGQMANGTLTLDIERPGGSSGPMALKKSDAGLTAAFNDGGKSVTVELRKAVSDEISGEWDAVADAQGQAVPFTLSLKVDGDKVTGSSNSQLGTASISNGTWKDGKLSIVLEGGSGQITMVATIVDGKLSGDFDFAGQMSGKWVAQKKK